MAGRASGLPGAGAQQQVEGDRQHDGQHDAHEAPARPELHRHLRSSVWWHPAKESANLTPARAQAGALAKAADAWAASAVPAACDSAATRASVKKVQDGSRAFAQLVAGKGADAAVLAALRELHEQFEVVNRGCKVK